MAGNVGTRGPQQIAKENVETITLYRNMIWGANGISFLIKIIQGASLSSQISIMALLQYYIVPLILLSMIYSGCLQFLSKMGTPRTSEPDGKGQLIDPGHDLNMNGMARRVKLCIHYFNSNSSNFVTLLPELLLVSPFCCVNHNFLHFNRADNQKVTELKIQSIFRKKKSVLPTYLQLKLNNFTLVEVLKDAENYNFSKKKKVLFLSNRMLIHKQTS